MKRVGCSTKGLTHVKLLRRLAESSVVLFDKVPADLILGKVVVSVCVDARLQLVLLGEAAVGSHDVWAYMRLCDRDEMGRVRRGVCRRRRRGLGSNGNDRNAMGGYRWK